MPARLTQYLPSDGRIQPLQYCQVETGAFMLSHAVCSSFLRISLVRQARHALLLGALTASLPLSASAEHLYVSNEDDNSISVIDVASGKVTGTVDVGKRPRGLKLS